MEPFLDAFERQQEERQKQMNFQAYMTGLYVRAAIVSALDSGTSYPEEPYDVRTKREIEEFRSSAEYVEQQRLIMLAKMRQDERRKRKEEALTTADQKNRKE